MRKILYILLAALGIACVVVLCSIYRYHSARASQSMYENAEYWFDNGREIDESLADVFYVLPTCVFDWKMSRHASALSQNNTSKL